MAITAYGPIYAAGTEDITKSGYKITFLPDLHNEELQQSGQPPVYYWLPNEVRLARKLGDTGPFRFMMLHFEGVMHSSTNIGANADNEVAGGVLNFSTTAAPPGAVLKEAEDDLLNRWRGQDDKYWGWRSPIAPMFRPAVIVSNTTSVTNLAPGPDGGVPTVTPPPNGSHPAGGGRAGPRDAPPPIQVARSLPPMPMPRSVPISRGYRSGLDPMAFRMQGQGPGSVNPDADNAYSALLGSTQAAIVWASFHQGTSALSVWQLMQLRVWSPMMRLVIEGDWDRIQDHFSAAVTAEGLFFKADLQAQFNNMRMSGDIQVTTEVDSTLPNADKLQDEMNKRSDLVFQKFMDEAQKVIFDPAPFSEQPAQAQSGGIAGGLFGGIFGGGGVAMKLRRDHTHLHLRYEEHKEMAYLQPYPISGALDGLYDELRADPSAEKRYFITLYLGDWDRKVTTTVKPVVNWPDSTRKWVGEPVAFIGVQVGYPNTAGALEWDAKVFQPTDPPDSAFWTTAVEQKNAADVVNPPPGWTPDKTFVKRTIHFAEAPSPAEDPYVRVQIEKQIVDLDPGPTGILNSVLNLEVRADGAGLLAAGPISIDAQLDPGQIVEVTFQAQGNRADGKPRDPVKFSWNSADQDKERYWTLFTGDPAFSPKFKYQVHVVTKHSLFSHGQEWFGPWVDAAASGAFMVSVPAPDSPGVTTKSIPWGAMSAVIAKASSPVPSGDGHAGPPPVTAGPTPATTPSSGPPPARRSADDAGGLGGWTVGDRPGSRGAPEAEGEPAEREVVFSSFGPPNPA